MQATDFRMDKSYVQYYILLCNFFFMGLLPCTVMIMFNVMVVRAVDEANKRRARMSKRQQRNITVTSMLVTVVIVFLACHSVKLVLSLKEVRKSEGCMKNSGFSFLILLNETVFFSR